WPQHIAMKRWFLSRIPRDKHGHYLEVGPGHGYYFMAAQKKTSYDFFTVVDISPASVKMTKTILESGFFGTFKNYEITLGDFLSSELTKKFNAIIMAEVLEHVEEPEHFLQKVKRLSAAD